jgi:hypothetical protein
MIVKKSFKTLKGLTRASGLAEALQAQWSPQLRRVRVASGGV